MPLHDQITAAADAIADLTGYASHDVAAVLGSGYPEFATSHQDPISIPYEEIPGFPTTTVASHSGVLQSALIDNARTLVCAGRVHANEGRHLAEVALPVRAAVATGCRSVILANAAGGVDLNYCVGSLVAIRDHVNLAGSNRQVGVDDPRIGPLFLDLTDLYSARLRRLAASTADALQIDLSEGVYAWFLGPIVETPVEIVMAKTLGASLVGMSTVPEAIAAHHMEAEVLAVSVVTNAAAGIGDGSLSLEEVFEAAKGALPDFSRFLMAMIAQATE